MVQDIINKLKNDGVDVSDVDFVSNVLNKYSYYSVVIKYRNIFMKDDKYRDNASFKEIYALFMFDGNLKLIFLKYTLLIESVVKNRLSILFNKKYDGKDILVLDNFDNKNKKNISHINNLFKMINEEIFKIIGKDSHIEVYYMLLGHLPPFILVDILTYGMVSSMYKVLKQKDRQEISKYFNLSDKNFNKIFYNLKNIRNICAHNMVLFTYRNDTFINLDKGRKKLKNKVLHTSLYTIIKCLEILLEKNEYQEFITSVNKEIINLSNSLTSITIMDVLKVMGYSDEKICEYL